MIKEIKARVKLNNGVEMPWLGLGVFRLREGGPFAYELLKATAYKARNRFNLIFLYNRRLQPQKVKVTVGKIIKSMLLSSACSFVCLKNEALLFIRMLS